MVKNIYKKAKAAENEYGLVKRIKNNANGEGLNSFGAQFMGLWDPSLLSAILNNNNHSSWSNKLKPESQ